MAKFISSSNSNTFQIQIITVVFMFFFLNLFQLNSSTNLASQNITTGRFSSAKKTFSNSTTPSATQSSSSPSSLQLQQNGSTFSSRRRFDPPETTPIPTVNEEWGGNCTETDWKKCSTLKTYFSYYVDKNDPEKKIQHHEIDCKIQPIICLKNGWTVTRCQILCMGRCNKELISKYDDYVEKDGQC